MYPLDGDVAGSGQWTFPDRLVDEPGAGNARFMQLHLADVMAVLRHHRRALLVFHLFFAGAGVAVLTPIFSWALATVRPVTGHAAVTTGGLVEFLMSAGGLLWVMMAGGVIVLITLLQQAGMVRVVATGDDREYRIAIAAVWTVARRFRALLTLAAVQVGAHLLLALPFILITGLAYRHLLVPDAVDFPGLETPVGLPLFIAVSACAALGLAVCNGWLYVRWVVAMPLVMLEWAGPLAALQRSATLTRPRFAFMAAVALGGLLMMIGLPAVFTVAFTELGGRILARLPDTPDIVVPAILGYTIVYTVLAIVAAFLATATHAVLLYILYRRATGMERWYRPQTAPARAGPLAWMAEAIVIILAVHQGTGVVMDSFDQDDKVQITAHRGSSLKAPENTLSAIVQAIEDGADFVEVDVRATADGTLILWHDTDIRRLTGIDQPLARTRFDELRDLDIGSRFGERFAGERVATLAEAIEAVRGRARLYLDIKPAPRSPDLASDLVALLHEKDAVEGTVVASTQRHFLQAVTLLEPRLSTALLAQFIVGPIRLGEQDALALRANRVTPARVARAHRAGSELHVWTVNDRDSMSRFLDMGVDNIITDRPELLNDLLSERAEMTEGQRLSVKMRNWLSDPPRGIAGR